jgi:hypothetical protein
LPLRRKCINSVESLADIKDKPNLLTVARLAGLEVVIAAFPDDLAVAAAAAEHARSTLPPIDDPNSQPWPPVKMRRTR